MKIFKYWAREASSHTSKDGQKLWLNKLAGSNESVASARVAAMKALQELKARFDTGEVFTMDSTYGYPANGEIREEVVQTFEDDEDKTIAAITRNRYGSLVLNAPKVLFADVDYPPLQRVGLFARLFGRGPKKADLVQSRRDDTLARVKAFSDAHPTLGLRVYETHSGLRVVITTALYDPTSEDSKSILTALDSDPLFQKLCQSQGCYRARLTIKPWRANLPRPPSVFPVTKADDKAAYKAWLKKYDAADAKHTVCRKLAEFGRTGIISEVEKILSIHDKHALGTSTLPLA